ncbi:MAG: SAM-dependent methyltransferase [Fusobacteria bacterium]|nr:SAM-dependent methyltransferase [Fusobacteriota bacterium]
MSILPDKFLTKYKKLLDENEFKEFIESLNVKPLSGIRYNQLKINQDDFLKKTGLNEDQVPWCHTGYYYNIDDFEEKLSINPYYHAGLYYFQEPSAMFPGELLIDVLENNNNDNIRIIDLCAAPGGKTTQVAMNSNKSDFILANEINPKRVRALKKNIELYGIKNCLVTNTTGKKLFESYGSYFDVVLIDAPCSGEGTFRKDKKAIKDYDDYGDSSIIKIQRDIIDYGVKLLKNNGILIYSTCTYDPDENENNIQYILNNYDFNVLEIIKPGNISDGRPEWINDGRSDLTKTARIWPHKAKGEGHFAARLIKLSGEEYKNKKNNIKWLKYNDLDLKVREFISKYLSVQYSDKYFLTRDNLVYMFERKYDIYLENKIQYMGTLLGEINKYQFVPGQSYIMTLKEEEISKKINLTTEDANRYIKGETLELSLDDGYYGVIYDGFPLGWCKAKAGVFKNLYDKNWRKSY